MNRGNEAWAEFLLALRLLTRLPVPDPGHTPERMAASVRWYPAAGAVIGLLVGGVYLLATLVFPVMLAVLIATGFGVFLTGALHEDGLADTCDGLGGGHTKERALEIMRDSRIGTYGAVGLGMVLAIKITALVAFPYGVFWVLVAGHALSRLSAVVVIETSDYARVDGVARPVAGRLDHTGRHIALASAGAVLLPLLIVMPIMAVLFGVITLALGHWLVRKVFEPKLGGYTGDCLGAVQQVSELGFYLGLLMWL